MLAKRVIPCLDVKDGKVVKGTGFADLKDVGHPPDLAERYSREGADEIAFLDIAATQESRGTTLGLVRETAERVFVPLTVGGGVRSAEDVHSALLAGADKVSINSAAVADPDIVSESAERFGRQCVVVAIDAKKVGGRYEVFVAGGTRPAGLDALEWAAEAEDMGAGEILLTSIGADGTADGYDIELTKAVVDEVSVPVIASGGCGSMEHIYEVFARTDCAAALAASIFHYGQCTPAQVHEYLRERGIEVRRLDLKFDAEGLLPVVVQDFRTNEVLMLAYSNEEAVEEMLRTGRTCFWSRSRQRLWRKGEESGHVQKIKSMQADCDSDALLVKVEQTGAACHTGAPSCFFKQVWGSADGTAQVIPDLLRVIEGRRADPEGGSYTCKLFADETKMCKKVVEEAAEFALAVKDHDKDGEASELADLVYHALVAVVKEGIPLDRMYEVLSERRQ